jgi:transmembrane sensor
MSGYTPEKIRQLGEASQWLARLRLEPDSEDAVTSWLRWCEEDPANAEAFERVQRLWRQMDQVSGEFDRLPADKPKVVHVSGGAASHGAGWRRGRRITRWRAAAAVLLCAGGAGGLWYGTHDRAADVPLEIAAPEDRLASLPDGSSIHLAAKTSIEVDFGGTERRLQMSSGEAYFKVRPDKHRPFVVHAGPLNVTAVGTAFDVKADDGRVSVTVQEGIVSVAPVVAAGAWASDAAWRVGPGYQFFYSERDGSAGLSSVDTSVALAWREGRLEYVNAPLAQVITDVNRYARHPVEISDPSVAGLTFTGTVFTDSIDGWLQGLPGALPVGLERMPGGAVAIRPAASTFH